MKKFSIKTTSIALSITLFAVASFANQEASEDSHNHKHKPEYKSQYNNEQNNEQNPVSNVKKKGQEKIKPRDDKHEEGISFSAEKMLLANIEVTQLTLQTFAKSIYAPGEIKANGYTSYIVSPRTESVIVSRHAILGEHVEKGQPLVTLFSESMADAQANYRVTYSEWQRVKKLNKGTISESRLLKTETEYNSALGRLTAFGLTQQAVNDIVKNNSSNLGEYTLVAKIAGAVLSDDFSQGQRVAPGDEIMILANEDNLWVEARVSPYKKLNLPIGTIAKIELGTQVHQAKVIQEAHAIDPITRTRIVRLIVENSDDTLHSGMFVNVNFQFNTPIPVMAVPETALMRGADGDWTVFVEDHPGEFNAVEVELGQKLGDYREIIGLAANSRVVTKGAFFVASEIAKGGFDPHNH